MLSVLQWYAVEDCVMLILVSTILDQDVERNCRGVRVELGGPDGQQQTPHQHANDPSGGEHRACGGYC